MKRFSLPLAAALSLFIAGCSDEEATPAPPANSGSQSGGALPSLTAATPDASAPVTPGAATTLPQPVTQAVSPDMVDEEGNNVLLEGLNTALRSFRKDNEELPRSLHDLVKAGYIPRIPAAPSGKRFEIDQNAGTVVLVAN